MDFWQFAELHPIITTLWLIIISATCYNIAAMLNRKP